MIKQIIVLQVHLVYLSDFGRLYREFLLAGPPCRLAHEDVVLHPVVVLLLLVLAPCPLSVAALPPLLVLVPAV